MTKNTIRVSGNKATIGRINTVPDSAPGTATQETESNQTTRMFTQESTSTSADDWLFL